MIDVRPDPSERTRPLYGPAGTVVRLHEIFSGWLPPTEGNGGASGVNAADEDVVGTVDRCVVLGALADEVEVEGGGAVLDDDGSGATVATVDVVTIVCGIEAGPTAALDPQAASTSAPHTTERTASPCTLDLTAISNLHLCSAT